MDNIIERIFIKNFISGTFQDRLAFELGSEKNRLHGICRFSHEAEKYLKPNNIILRGEKLNIAEIESVLIDHGCQENDEVYYISTDEKDGMILTLKNALQLSLDDYSPSIIICNDTLAFVKAEVSIGSPMKYILLIDKNLTE